MHILLWTQNSDSLLLYLGLCRIYKRKQDSTVLLQYQSVVIDITFVSINFVKYCIPVYEAFTL